MPLLKRGSVRVGKWALKIGMHIADDFTSGQNIKLVAKKRAMDAHKDMKSSRFKANPGVRQQQQQQQQKRRQRIKRVTMSRCVDAMKIRLSDQACDVFDDGLERTGSLRRSVDSD